LDINESPATEKEEDIAAIKWNANIRIPISKAKSFQEKEVDLL